MPETRGDPYREERERRAAYNALPGILHEFGKAVVVFAHPLKVVRMERDARLLATSPVSRSRTETFDEQMERLRRHRPYAVAFLPSRIGRERYEILTPYLLPFPYHDIARVPAVLKQRKSLNRANAGDVGFVLGRSEIGTLMPFSSRDRLTTFLRGHCPTCGHQSHPDLLERLK